MLLRLHRGAALAAILAAAAACTDVGEFSTELGECYHGAIVGASFVRSGFEPGVEIYLSLDTRALAEGKGPAGVIKTSDGTFSSAAVSQMEQLSHDSLSQLQFPGGRIRNYLAHAVAADGGTAFMVISLMENDEVELRLIRPSVEEDAGPGAQPPLFGIFRLALEESCDVFGSE